MDNRIPGVQGDSREPYQSSGHIGQAQLLLRRVEMWPESLHTASAHERREKNGGGGKKGKDYYNIYNSNWKEIGKTRGTAQEWTYMLNLAITTPKKVYKHGKKKNMSKDIKEGVIVLTEKRGGDSQQNNLNMYMSVNTEWEL